MISGEIADRYSLALFELAREQNETSRFQQELQEVVRVVEESGLKKLLFHPRIQDGEKKELIKNTFAGKVAPELINFLNLLVDKKRIFFLVEIAERFEQRFKEEQEIVDIEAASAVELSSEQKSKLEEKLKKILNKKINVIYQVVPELIGGLRLRIGDRVIDGSLQYHLTRIEDRIRQLPVSMLGVNDHEVKS